LMFIPKRLPTIPFDLDSSTFWANTWHVGNYCMTMVNLQ
jgi:hypothetical protein